MVFKSVRLRKDKSPIQRRSVKKKMKMIRNRRACASTYPPMYTGDFLGTTSPLPTPVSNTAQRFFADAHRPATPGAPWFWAPRLEAHQLPSGGSYVMDTDERYIVKEEIVNSYEATSSDIIDIKYEPLHLYIKQEPPTTSEPEDDAIIPLEEVKLESDVVETSEYSGYHWSEMERECDSASYVPVQQKTRAHTDTLTLRTLATHAASATATYSTSSQIYTDTFSTYTSI